MDWELFRRQISRGFADLDGVGIVEQNAMKNGAVVEKQAREIFQAQYAVPVVCGHELFSRAQLPAAGLQHAAQRRPASGHRRIYGCNPDGHGTARHPGVRGGGAERRYADVRGLCSGAAGGNAALRPRPPACWEAAPSPARPTAWWWTWRYNHRPGAAGARRAGDGAGRASGSAAGRRMWTASTSKPSVWAATAPSITTTGAVRLEAYRVIPLCVAAQRYPSILRNLQGAGRVRRPAPPAFCTNTFC